MATDSLSHALTTYYIYALVNPENGKTFYIGQTVNFKSRKSHHFSCARSAHEKSLPVHRHMHYLLSIGITPLMEQLDEITTFHKKLVVNLEECWRINMLNHSYALANAWKTGVCDNTLNPVSEMTLIKSHALASESELEAYIESGLRRAYDLRNLDF
jgi:hypothetical protein